MTALITRRKVIAGSVAVAGAVAVSAVGTDRIVSSLRGASDQLTIRTQRLLLKRRPLVREFAGAEISKVFPTNGTRLPAGLEYRRFVETGFRDWTLRIDGLVQRPLRLSLPQLKRLTARQQTTMHCCDEGWSAIAQWTGVELGLLLTQAGLLPTAEYVVFHCLDKKEEDGSFYYESIDLFDAFHPQTILAYQINGKPLPVDYGAPLRLRVETQIGYKNAKYVDRIEVVNRLDQIGKGRGGWWEDFDNAVWYAGQ